MYSLFIFHNPFLEANPDCVDVARFHIVGKIKVDQTNKFHEVGIISRFCKVIAKNDQGNEHNPERPCLGCHVGVFLFKVWHPCSNCEGIVSPDAEPVLQILDHMCGGKMYSSEPVLRPLKFPV